ncbi:MAG: GntP family permease [Planctomycetia bacterium]|nr:GntP family permease [Planctomycetia bacterium]
MFISIIHDPFFILFVGLFLVIGMIILLRANAFFALITAAFVVSFLSVTNEDGSFILKISRVTDAFGTMAGKIGILIVMGTIIGKAMTESRAADRIVQSICRLFGEKRIPTALMGGGFVLSIPVFYDATFYLLLPLAKSVYRRTRKNYLLYLLAIGFGAMISHTMIPPTPGPLVVAETLNIPIGTMILIGLLVGALLVPIALLIAALMNRLNPNPIIRQMPDLFLSENEDQKTDLSGQKELSCLNCSNAIDSNSSEDDSLSSANKEPLKSQEKQDETDCFSETTPFSETVFFSENQESYPGFWASILPILLPVLFIAGASIVNSITQSGKTIESSQGQTIYQWIQLIGDPQMALILAAIIAIWVYKSTRKISLRELEKSLEEALSSAGVIILITAAGGAFGAMLRESGIGERIETVFMTDNMLSGSLILIVAFSVASMMKTAQGSSTTAMITTANIFASLNLSAAILGFHPVYLALTIGIGSCVTSWMNDSGFCVFSRMSGISETDSLKSWTLGIALIGFSGLFIVLVLSRLLPLTSL